MIATTRIVMPKSIVRLSAGRTEMSDEGQALCFLSGASSIFSGDKLLTTPNPDIKSDMELFKILGLKTKAPFVDGKQPQTIKNQEKLLCKNEKVIWNRPKHKILKNEEYKEKAKSLNK